MSNDPNADRSTPSPREPLSEQVIKLTAQWLQLVARTKRIALLEALTHGEAGVQDLADHVGLTHQNASYHLTLLLKAGVLSRRSEGSMTIYAIKDWSAWWIVKQIVDLMRSYHDDQAPSE